MTYLPGIDMRGLMYEHEHSRHLSLCSLGHRRVDSSTEIRVMKASLKVVRAERTLGEMDKIFLYLG